MRVYLDICAIQRPLDDQSQLRIRLEAEAVLGILTAIAAGELELVASDMHYVETFRNPYPERRDLAIEVLARASKTSGLTNDISSRAAEFMKSGIDVADSLHLAAAIEMKSAFFCTTDDKLIARGRSMDTGGMLIVTPLELAAKLEEP